MNKRTVLMLDHGDDPGRYTLIRGDGRIATMNMNGSVLFRRHCQDPGRLFAELTREPGVRAVAPKLIPDLLKKFTLLSPDNNDD